ncbi:MAG TPA: glutamate-5-semialdehyde dehydrogenase [Pseudogracilibacillus sp.]|nr:glutamate-5-semialdehyde dehydrogenase [Pseudogracilibacillus sp.]
MSEILTKGKAAKLASYELSLATTEEKNEALRLIAEQMVADQNAIIAANKLDLEAGEKAGLDSSVLDRIMINEERIEAMANGIHLLIDLHDPIGEVIENSRLDNGLLVEKIRVPIGVIGMIYEARPNVTIDAANLSLKTNNAVILRGSSSAIHTNTALVASIHNALRKSSLPVDAVSLIEDTSRETAKELFRLNEYLDVLIPRGGAKLIETVIRESTVPVIETGAGNCHAFIDASASEEMTQNIILNAKLQRPSVCNAIESIVMHKDWFEKHGLALLEKLAENDVEIFSEEAVVAKFPQAKEATEDDWAKEYLGMSISVKLVDSAAEAVDHINTYGTHHSDTIITEDEQNKKLFLQKVDSTTVYHNASTRFTDGFEFGYGAEIGISTQKLHARGPMGLQALTSTKFVVQGNGQVRA